MNPFKGRIAAHTITWGHNHIQALEEVSKLGYTGIEPWASFALQYEDNPEQFQAILAGYGLEITALYGGASEGQKFGNLADRSSIVENNVRIARMVAKCGADILVLGPGGNREQPSTVEELQIAATTVNEIAERTYALGVKTCVHPHLWTEWQDENEVELLMSLTNPKLVYLAPDSAHLLGAGMDPAAIIRKYQARVAYVHLKDLTDKSAATPDVHLPHFCELGKGSVDLHRTLEALKEIHYSGWVTLEVDESMNTPYNTMEICRDFVEQELKIPVRI